MTVVQDWAPLFTAGGVVVGVLLGWIGTFVQSRVSWKRDQNKDLNVVAAELVATTARAWSARNWIARTVFSLVNAEATQNHALVAQLQAERMEGFAELREPSVLTAWHLARIQILRPSLADKARALVEASDRVVQVTKLEEIHSARETALAAFMAAVSAELGVKGS